MNQGNHWGLPQALVFCYVVFFIAPLGGCEDRSPAPNVPALEESIPVSQSTVIEQPIRMSQPETAVISSTLRELGYFRPLAEECCTKPGDASECWMNDADQDEVLCAEASDCESKSCDKAEGRCRCTTTDDCGDGICVNGLCGPSWCNGYLVCSCWGGCEWWSTVENQTLHDLAAEQGLFCCEGLYAAAPIDIDPSLGGYFSPTPCGGCSEDSHCDDNNPCTQDRCQTDSCVYTNLTGSQDAIPDAADCPFNNTIYASDCARAQCNNGNCTVELNWNEGQNCSGTPKIVPDGLDNECYQRICTAEGSCGIQTLAGQSCNVGQNPCSDAACDADGFCIDAPQDAAVLAANPECCNPTVPESFDDSHSCTDDYCCYEGSAAPTCANVRAYTDRNVPNYDATNPGDCCMNSADCDDANGCTENICCGAANAGLAICGANVDSPSWECVQSVEDVPGCCDSAPANLADNCQDIFSCTEDTCCTPALIAAAVNGDACFGVDSYNCAQAHAFDVPPAGCCDPDDNPLAHCDDANVCTVKSCDAQSHACQSVPQPLIDGCCGPNPTDACGDADGNICTDELCCDPFTIASSVSGDPCFAAPQWSCGVAASTVPGCCSEAADCDDGNPCTEDLCVDNACQWDFLADLSAVLGTCCNNGGVNDVQCSDASDAGDCTQNVCCSSAMVLAASPGDPCFNVDDWSCQNPVETPLIAGCCTASTYATDCNPDSSQCVTVECQNNNCIWQGNNNLSLCCSDDGDCPPVDGSNPCLASSSCDFVGTPLTNTHWAQCDLSYAVAGTVCGAGGDCFNEVCGDPANENMDCNAISYVPADTQMCSPPNAPPCGQYWCDGSGECTDITGTFNTYANQTCEGQNLGADVDIEQLGATNICAPDNFEPVSTGIYSECSGATYSDVVYNYTDVVTDNYDLIHRVITVTDINGDWDSVVSTRSDCAAPSSQGRCNDNCAFWGSNYNTGDYGGPIEGACSSGASTVVTSPKAVTDVPNHVVPGPVPVDQQDFDDNGIRDGYDVARTHQTSVIVDSRYSTPDNGGDFNLDIVEESHNNNDCRSTGSYTPAPLIDGNFQWKQRWRGLTSSGEYDDYFGSTGAHQAFFKLEIPAGTGKYLAYSDWNALDKRGEAGHQIDMDSATFAASFYNTTVSKIFEDGGNPNECSNSNMESAGSDNGWPPQMFIDASDSTYENAWLAVENRNAGEYGAYELTVLKLQPDFFGFAAGYSDWGIVNANDTAASFDAAGYRLDFIPSGGVANGYLMTVANIGSGPDTCPGRSGSYDAGWDWGWLVHPKCYRWGSHYNEWTNQRAHSVIKRLPFKFPMGNEHYSYAYFDTSGRMTLLNALGTTSCNLDSDCTSISECAAAPQGCVCATNLTDKKCFYDPGPIDVQPDVDKFFTPVSDGGYAPLIAGAWGSFQPKWVKNNRYGYLTAQTAVFEGTTAFVLSYVAMDMDTSAPNTSSFPNNNSWNKNYSHPSWQVILRVDGRIAFYYRPRITKNAWNRAVNKGAFVSGISGGIATANCSNDADCNAAYGVAANAKCDNIPAWGYTPTQRCYRSITPLVGSSDGLGNE